MYGAVGILLSCSPSNDDATEQRGNEAMMMVSLSPVLIQLHELGLGVFVDVFHDEEIEPKVAALTCMAKLVIGCDTTAVYGKS